MDIQARLFSEVYTSVKLNDSFTAGISESLWSRILREHESGRIFLRIECQEKDWICPMGQPIKEIDSDSIFLPTWMMECAGFPDTAEMATITVFTEEAFPESTRLVLRVVDSAFYNSEVKGELERILTHIGVVKKHTLLQLPIEGLGGYQVEVFVADTEPADVVLCNGDEVVVEFEEPVDQIQPRVPTPIQERPPTPIPEPTPVLPDAIIQPEEPRGFVPFRGEGYTLGGSNHSIPEWRRNLPPRRQNERQV